MNKEEFNNKIKEIGEMSSPEEMRTELVTLSEKVNQVFTDNETFTKQHEDDLIEMEKIRSANMKLFTQLGSEMDEKTVSENKTGLKQETVEKREFKNLFDEKGNFK